MSGHALALIGAVDPALLDLVELSLTGEDCLVIRASLMPDVDDGVVRLTSWGHGGAAALDLRELAGGPAVVDVPIPTDCLTCSLREVLLAVAEDRARDEPQGTTVVLLPPAIELPHLVPGLAHDLEEMAQEEDIQAPAQAHLAGVAHLIDAERALADLLDHHPLTESGLALSEHDTRCTGEVHLVNLGYADVIVSVGHEAAESGADLVEHLRPLDTLLLPGLDAPLLDCLLNTAHDADSALRHVHPATTQAWGGPDQHGVWTLDLSATLPFHPVRLREMVAELAGRGLCARGCFWLPSRPGRVCAWEVVGGSVNLSDAGTWSEAPPGLPERENIGGAGTSVDTTEPHCHLVVTGVGDEEQKRAVEAAFAAVLLREDELADSLAWIGAADGLENWLGEEA
ncbi:GTP-binding protein [Actinomyces trachealis]|uniref:GTP-binding protein n=1 Tax=Actinomyces trachealis TaxID=2763540 RepID=UPI00189295D1|nr:GTP-binding protein [Actinomyces trachealis]